MDNSNEHVWKSTVALLGRISSPDAGVGKYTVSGPDNGRGLAKRAAAARAGGRPADLANCTIVDRISACSIMVRWGDATAGHYGEQLWKRGIARRSTYCILSGMRVRRGDIVYRPCTRGLRPANCEEVILAGVLEEADGGLCQVSCEVSPGID
ncbi:uncharacterized protein DUF3331 [Paraburkholderia unamae]|uniref:DUF3331 domain-containing protein n=1 Tax=Paraburkholderia unamae TaxID=219649 RepID=UPI000DC48E07|nr:DUF3331 domain-containing protein [Paraburkholderia unamae]RAR62328.1 uncharacterized protein DUF3331 [Paraburkholderia unamae]